MKAKILDARFLDMNYKFLITSTVRSDTRDAIMQKIVIIEKTLAMFWF